MAHDVRLLETERVLKLAHEVDEVGEGVLEVEPIAQSPANLVNREHAQGPGKGFDVEEPALGIGGEANPVQEDHRGTGSRFEVPSAPVAQRDGLLGDGHDTSREILMVE